MVAGAFLELLPSGLFGEVIHSPLLCSASPGLSPPLLPHQRGAGLQERGEFCLPHPWKD